MYTEKHGIEKYCGIPLIVEKLALSSTKQQIDKC